MGVHGLWQLLHSVGSPVTLESLENKVLAVDVSIWLHQAVRGCRNPHGGPVHNAHLLTLFNRICKLLFYRIKPIFVFDGAVPLLKKQTMAARRQRKDLASKESQETLQKLVLNLVQTQHIREKIENSQGPSGQKRSPEKRRTIKSISSSKQQPDMFELPSLPQETLLEFEEMNRTIESDSDEEDIWLIGDDHLTNRQNINSVDVHSEDFKSLPFEIQHELLTDLKESRKKNSWLQMDEMPKNSENFSSFQMDRLLKRRNLQQRLEQVEKEMNAADTSAFGLDSNQSRQIALTSQRIASEDGVHYILGKKINQPARNVQESEKTTEEVKAASSSSDVSSSSRPITIINEESMSSDEEFEEMLQTIQKSTRKSREANTNEIHENKLSILREERFDERSKLSFDILVDKPVKANDGQFSETCMPEIESGNRDSENHVTSITNDTNRFENVESKSENLKPVDEVKLDNTVALPVETDFGMISNFSTHVTNCDIVQTESTPAKGITVNHEPLLVNTDESSNSEDDFIEVSNVEIIDEIYNNFGGTGMKSGDESNIQNEIMNEQSPERTNEEAMIVDEDEILDHSRSGPSVEELKELEQSLEEEEKSLRKEKAKLDSVADSITNQMYTESQELLRLFGIPFVISPAEAEAQCAMLNTLGLSHGTITDDSDVWLFGGESVYKNFFNHNKFVECYKVADIKTHFNLDRTQLICIALMAGSDYTDGIEGIGYVTAIEILSEFPGEGLECLRHFKQWWDKAQESPAPAAETKLKKKLRQFTVPAGFPNEVVLNAYLQPKVDDSEERFSWNMPDLASLRDFACSKFGWTISKVDDILLPIMKKLNVKETQTRIDSFFKLTLKKDINKVPSKRLKRAIQKATNKSVPQTQPDVEDPRSKAVRILQQKKQRGSKRKTKDKLLVNEQLANAPMKILKPKRKRTVKEPKEEKKCGGNIQQVELSEGSSDD